MITIPQIEEHTAQPYLARRTQVPMHTLPTVIPQQLGEVFGWVGQQGVAPARGCAGR